jgi:hypothetical protein
VKIFGAPRDFARDEIREIGKFIIHSGIGQRCSEFRNGCTRR